MPKELIESSLVQVHPLDNTIGLFFFKSYRMGLDFSFFFCMWANLKKVTLKPIDLFKEIWKILALHIWRLGSGRFRLGGKSKEIEKKLKLGSQSEHRWR